jgi:hypothetical protein
VALQVKAKWTFRLEDGGGSEERQRRRPHDTHVGAHRRLSQVNQRPHKWSYRSIDVDDDHRSETQKKPSRAVTIHSRKSRDSGWPVRGVTLLRPEIALHWTWTGTLETVKNFVAGSCCMLVKVRSGVRRL